MLLIGLVKWWYSAGWMSCVQRVINSLASTYDYFSIDLLLHTFFAPFRQISAGKVRGSLQVQLRAWFDRLISRVIGAIVRSGVIVAGCIALAISAIIGLIRIVLWPLTPAIFVACIVFAIVGWMPWKI